MKLILAWIWTLELDVNLGLDFGYVMKLVFGLNLDFNYDVEILLDLTWALDLDL